MPLPTSNPFTLQCIQPAQNTWCCTWPLLSLRLLQIYLLAKIHLLQSCHTYINQSHSSSNSLRYSKQHDTSYARVCTNMHLWRNSQAYNVCSQLCQSATGSVLRVCALLTDTRSGRQLESWSVPSTLAVCLHDVHRATKCSSSPECHCSALLSRTIIPLTAPILPAFPKRFLPHHHSLVESGK